MSPSYLIIMQGLNKSNLVINLISFAIILIMYIVMRWIMFGDNYE